MQSVNHHRMADPEQPSQSSPSHAAAPSQLGSSLLKGKRIVIVEDEGLTLMHLRKVCTLAGIQVVGTAGDGERGVQQVLETQPDIVLMDINMPLLDGFAATERILKEHSLCVVMLTAYDMEEYQSRAYELGASGYILKPITASTLIPQLEAAYKQFTLREH
ncbi:MAG: response regulator transcription factor [Armatimonas sp.]